MKYDMTIRVETDDIDATQALLYAKIKPVYPLSIEALIRVHDYTPAAVVETDPRLYGRVMGDQTGFLPNGRPTVWRGDGAGWQGE